MSGLALMGGSGWANASLAQSGPKRIYLALDDHTELQITNQGGATHFMQRFALTTHDAFDPVEAMRFALEHQNPLAPGVITGSGALPEQSYSLLKVSQPGIFVWAVKPAEEGIEHGVIARVWNLTHRPVEGTLEFAEPLDSARQTTHIETDLEEVRPGTGREWPGR
ncbi:MAG: hypothetical protein ACREEM_25140 [Blastocatellia bacterium]